MATVAQLMVSIGADIASLKQGMEQANKEVGQLRSKVDTHAKSMQSSFETSIAGIKAAWIAGMAKIGAATYAATKAWGLMKLSAEYEEQRGILDNLARKYNTTADSMVSSMQTASDHLISRADLMQVALGGISKGLNPTQLTNLADAARILGDAVGNDATTALQDLTQALETGRTRGLKTYIGTALDLETAFGNLTSNMSAAEKAQAMYNLTMIQAVRLQSQQTKEVNDTADRMERLNADFKNMTLTLATWGKVASVSLWDMGGALFSLPSTQIAKIGQEAAKSNRATTGSILERARAQKEALAPYEREIEALKRSLASKDTATKKTKEHTRAIREQKVATEEWIGAYVNYSILELKRAEQKKSTEAQDIADRIANENRIAELYVSIDRERTKRAEYLADLERGIVDMQAQTLNTTMAGALEGSPFAGNAQDLFAMEFGQNIFDDQLNDLAEYYQARKDFIASASEEELMQQFGIANRKLLMERDFSSASLQTESINTQKKIAMQAQAFGLMGNLMMAFYNASNSRSKAFFYAYKSFQIAQTLTTTYLASMLAYASQLIPGDPTSIARAEAARNWTIGMGIANAALIAATAIGGGAKSGSGGGGGVGTGSAAQTTMTQATQASVNTGPSINIYVQGHLVNHDEFAREVLPSIMKAQEDRVR